MELRKNEKIHQTVGGWIVITNEQQEDDERVWYWRFYYNGKEVDFFGWKTSRGPDQAHFYYNHVAQRLHHLCELFAPLTRATTTEELSQ